MAPQSSRLTVSAHGDVIHVGFVDRNILEEATILQIGEEIAHLIDQASAPKILINFASVEHLSSAALGQLITVNNKVRQKGGQLRLCEIDPQIYEVFVITRLNKLFQIHENVEKASKSFK